MSGSGYNYNYSGQQPPYQQQQPGYPPYVQHPQQYTQYQQQPQVPPAAQNYPPQYTQAPSAYQGYPTAAQPQQYYPSGHGVPQVPTQPYPPAQHSHGHFPPPQASAFSQHHASSHPHTGKKKALLIGINYFNQKGQLRGCVNDVKNMSSFLIDRYGYKREDMVILTDDQQNPRSIPTKQNIIQAMHWLVKDAKPGDSLFFHYSGHGGQAKDVDGDENDGYDETIYPVDFRYHGHIIDDDMHAIMVAPLQAGVRLTAIFDSCHSGSALDLPFLYSTQGNIKETGGLRQAGEGLIDVLSHYSKGDVASMFSSGSSLIKQVTVGREIDERARRTKTSPADVVQWSGSKDTQKSADTTEGGEATGAMSHAFIAALSKNPHQSYQQLLQSIRRELEGKYSQKPQLSCSHPLGKDDQFEYTYAEPEYQ